jgi:hypothetical protein
LSLYAAVLTIVHVRFILVKYIFQQFYRFLKRQCDRTQVHPSAAYETTWYSTQDCFKGGPWPGNASTVRATVPGQSSVAASAFCCGAAALFERDCYGSPAQASTCFPRSEAAAAEVLNGAMGLFRDAFDWGAEFAVARGESVIK